jgi:hypothetical protein
MMDEKYQIYEQIRIVHPAEVQNDSRMNGTQILRESFNNGRKKES